MTGARRPPWRVGHDYSKGMFKTFGISDPWHDNRIEVHGDAALRDKILALLNGAEHNAAGAAPSAAPHSIKQIGFFRGPIFGCSCGKTQMDQAEAWQHATEVSGTSKEGFVPVAAPVAACPEPAGEVEWLVPADMLDELRRIWSAYPEGCWIPKALTDLHNARDALARRPAEGWRDMASAPKDGSGVLLLDAANDVAAGRFCLGSDWNPIVAALAGEAGYWQAAHSMARIKDPTHWMPLPAPPRDEGGER